MQEQSASETTANSIQEHDNTSTILRPSTGRPSNTSVISVERNIRYSVEPAFVSLPDSDISSESIDTTLSDYPPEQGLHTAAQRLEHGNEQDMDPSTASLPVSRSVSSLEVFPGSPIDITPPRSLVSGHVDIETFGDMRAAFQSVLPHVKIMWRARSVHRARGNISILNAAPATASERPFRSYPVSERSVQHINRALVEEASRDNDPQVVIVEDLSPKTIELIYAMFKPNPEFFEQHLKGSLYGTNEGSTPPHVTEDSLGSTIWITNLLPRNHCSLRWWRPVMRHNRTGIDAADWTRFLEHGHAEFSASEGNWSIKNRVLKVPNISRAEFHDMARISDAKDITMKTNERKSIFNFGRLDKSEQIEKHNIAVTAWEERVTIHYNSRGGVTSIVILTDPLPKLRQEKENSELDEEWLPFTQVCPRGRPTATPDGTLDNISTFSQAEDLKRYLSTTSSSRSDILSWMSTGSVGDLADRQTGPWQAILEVVELDTQCFLGIILETLDKITEGITNEIILQDRLYEWRPLVTRYLLELPRLRASLLDFGSFMATCRISGKPRESIDRLSRRIDEAYLQTEKVYNSLRTEMSIIDSRRGIAEAEGVSKLTELAFIFIPITFAASIFSMQIKELKTAPPLSSFIIAALLCVIISYAMRLSTRSDILLNTKRRMFDEVRGRYGIPPNRPVPTRGVVAYLVYLIFSTVFSKIPKAVVDPVFESDRSGLISYILVMCAVLTAVLTLLWTKSHLNVFFKAAITVLSVAMVLIATWCTAPHKLSVIHFLASRLEKKPPRRISRDGSVLSV